MQHSLSTWTSGKIADRVSSLKSIKANRLQANRKSQNGYPRLYRRNEIMADVKVRSAKCNVLLKPLTRTRPVTTAHCNVPSWRRSGRATFFGRHVKKLSTHIPSISFLSWCLHHRLVGDSCQPISVWRQLAHTEPIRANDRYSDLDGRHDGRQNGCQNVCPGLNDEAHKTSRRSLVFRQFSPVQFSTAISKL